MDSDSETNPTALKNDEQKNINRTLSLPCLNETKTVAERRPYLEDESIDETSAAKHVLSSDNNFSVCMKELWSSANGSEGYCSLQSVNSLNQSPSTSFEGSPSSHDSLSPVFNLQKCLNSGQNDNLEPDCFVGQQFLNLESMNINTEAEDTPSHEDESLNKDHSVGNNICSDEIDPQQHHEHNEFARHAEDKYSQCSVPSLLSLQLYQDKELYNPKMSTSTSPEASKLDMKFHDSCEEDKEFQSYGLSIARRMSTIEEVLEDTPSPRSYVDISAEFKNALKVLYRNKDLLNVSEEDLLSEGNNYEEPNSEDQEKNMIQSPTGVRRTIDDALSNRETGLNFRNDETDSCITDSVFIENHVQESDTELVDLSKEDCEQSDQLFDINLDSYNIPHQRRKSLEVKLNLLRSFVDKILADRKYLEKDRALLEDAISCLRGPDDAIVSTEKKETFAADANIADIEASKRCQVDAVNSEEYNDRTEMAADGGIIKDCKLKMENDNVQSYDRMQSVISRCDDNAMLHGKPSNIDEGAIDEGEITTRAISVTEYEDLLFNLEETMLENVDLKNENKDLSEINDDLRQRIEQLMIDAEEMQYRMNEKTLKIMDECQRQREENSVLKSNFNRVLKDYNSLENEFKDLETRYQELLSERQTLVTKISIKNESLQCCKEHCDKLSIELEDLRKQIESCSVKQEKIWGRSDWEEWTVLQTQLASTEKALLDSRKQKAQLVADIKMMRYKLEATKDKMEEAENAVSSLEWTVKRAQENNSLLQIENEELRSSLIKYEMQLLEMERINKEKEQIAETRIIDEIEAAESLRLTDEKKTEDESKLNRYCQSCGKDLESTKEDNNPTFEIPLNHGPGRSNLRKIFSYPLIEAESFPYQCGQENNTQADEFADGQYQNAFQEIQSTSKDADIQAENTQEMKDTPTKTRTDNEIDDNQDCLTNRKQLKQGNKKSCLSLKMLLPSVMHHILHAKSKRAKGINEEVSEDSQESKRSPCQRNSNTSADLASETPNGKVLAKKQFLESCIEMR